jgi:hypothetical protein
MSNDRRKARVKSGGRRAFLVGWIGFAADKLSSGLCGALIGRAFDVIFPRGQKQPVAVKDMSLVGHTSITFRTEVRLS